MTDRPIVIAAKDVPCIDCGERYPSVAMDFDLPPDDHPARERTRDWIAANPNPTGAQLAEAGYMAPHWPRPWGLRIPACAATWIRTRPGPSRP